MKAIIEAVSRTIIIIATVIIVIIIIIFTIAIVGVTISAIIKSRNSKCWVEGYSKDFINAIIIVVDVIIDD